MSSYLFVPANRPERFIKACQTNADAVIIDLEDTIANIEKDTARKAIACFDFNQHKAFANQKLWLRINNSEQLKDDVDWITNTKLNIDALIIPKIENKETLDWIFHKTALPQIALIESVKGVANLHNIAQATGLMAMSFGLLDLGRNLGVVYDSKGAKAVFDNIRYQLLFASRLNGLQKPIETIFKNFQDSDGFIKNATFAYEMGFGGQLCIHPSQVNLAKLAYRPSTEQLTLAQAIVEHFDSTNDYAFSVQGMMVDLPLIEWARQLVYANDD